LAVEDNSENAPLANRRCGNLCGDLTCSYCAELAADTDIALQPEDIDARWKAAVDLAEAIGEAHPDDAVQIMSAALIDLTTGRGWPDIFLSAKEDAEWWASIAAPEVLEAALSAVLDNLGNRAMHLKTRKRLFLTLWRNFGQADRDRFLAFAKGEA
jgi:hypothetical protein